MCTRALAQLSYSLVVRADQPAALLILRDYSSAVIRRKEACSASGSHADRNRVNARIT